MDQSTWSWPGLLCYRNAHQKLQKARKITFWDGPRGTECSQGQVLGTAAKFFCPWPWSPGLTPFPPALSLVCKVNAIFDAEDKPAPFWKSVIAPLSLSECVARPTLLALFPQGISDGDQKEGTQRTPLLCLCAHHAHSDSWKDPAAFVNSNSKMDAWRLGEPQWMVGER